MPRATEPKPRLTRILAAVLTLSALTPTAKADTPPRAAPPKFAIQLVAGDAYSPPPERPDTDRTRGFDAGAEGVVREDLAPVLSNDGSGLPLEIWGSMSVAEIEELLGAIELPPRSEALHALFERLLTSNAPPPSGNAAAAAFDALRAEVLDRAGLLDEAVTLVRSRSATSQDSVLAAVTARIELSVGNRDEGCRKAREIIATVKELPPRLRGQAILVSAICTAAAGNLEAAALHKALATEAGAELSPGLDAIELFASGAKPAMAASGGGAVTVLDWRAYEIARAADANAALPNASPALLALLARAPDTPETARVLAAEAATAANSMAPADLAKVYASVPDTVTATQGGTDDPATSLARAALFQAAEAERTPARKARLIRSYLDQAKRSGLYWPALEMMAPASAAIPRIPELGWFAETAIETSLAAGNFEAARAWAGFGGGLDRPDTSSSAGRGFAHWRALADIADPTPGIDRARDLPSIEAMAVQGRIDPVTLHRIVTVLDALDVQVPISLWDVASRTPQPDKGYLPETGILPKLADASKKKEFGRTVLLAMRTLGPTGAEGAHIIALGDAIRALRRAGLSADAHKLALEALFASWPRVVTN
ncbi:MAG: hypothetical protein NW216_01670 [Hyphomicrobium sp.]|nr:hypothetical protein [Hyphomicrobium sp.]